jgi:hypothetical protein
MAPSTGAPKRCAETSDQTLVLCAGEYELYDRDVLAYVRDEDPVGLTEYFRRTASEAMGPSQAEPPEDAAQRVINGAWASAWLFLSCAIAAGP